MPTVYRRVWFSAAFVCLVFRTISLKTATAGITKLDVEMFHRESWKSIYFRSKINATRNKKRCLRGFLHSCECRLLLVVFMFDVGHLWSSLMVIGRHLLSRQQLNKTCGCEWCCWYFVEIDEGLSPGSSPLHVRIVQTDRICWRLPSVCVEE